MIEVLGIIFNIISFIFRWFLYIFSPLILAFILWGIWFLLILHCKIPKGSVKPPKRESFFKRILWDFPRRWWLDRINADPDAFLETGVHIIAGEQGSGKTITVTYLLQRLKKQYPKVRIRTNFDYLAQDESITGWEVLCNNTNGVYGQIEVLDEIQNWFGSLQSKDFPPDMLTEITQQRKQRKMIIGTSQVFTRVGKPIREQTTLLYEPKTIMGCLTIVPVYKPKINDDGTCDKKRLMRLFFFIHKDEVRNAFDTYKKVQNLVSAGFKPQSERISSEQIIKMIDKK